MSYRILHYENSQKTIYRVNHQANSFTFFFTKHSNSVIIILKYRHKYSILKYLFGYFV